VPSNLFPVINAVAEHYGIASPLLLGHDRTRKVTRARHVAMYLCRVRTQTSFPRIAAVFNQRDHSTVHRAYTTMSRRVDEDEDLAEAIRVINAKLLAP
jgi:chromosomal replication initiator protein